MEEALASIDTPLPVPSRPPQSSSTVISPPLSPPQVPRSRNEIGPFGPQTPPLPNSQQQFNNQKGIHVISPPGSQYKSTHAKLTPVHSLNGIGSPERHGLNNSNLLTLDTSSLNLDVTPSGGMESSHRQFVTNHPSQPIVPVSPTFKQQIEEHEKLVKDNFNLRLKLYYMDEKLRTMCENGNEGQEAVVHELIDTRAILEERVKDVEYRDQLLSQAQSAIEGLSEEVEHLKRWEGGAVDGTGTKTKESLSEVYQSEELEAAAQLQSRLAESQNQLKMACSEVECLRKGLDDATKDAERLRKAEESPKLSTFQKEEEILSLRKALLLNTEKTRENNERIDIGDPEEKEGLQQKLEEYENKLNVSIFERDRANVELGKVNGELDKLRGDLEKRKHILMGSYKDLAGCSTTCTNLGEKCEVGMEQEICAALASLTRELNASKAEVSGLQGLLGVANHEGHEKVQQLEGEAAVLKRELERERGRRGVNNREGYEKAQRLEGEVTALRRELERERDRGGEQHDLVRTLQRSLELAQSKLVTSNSRNAELRGELEAALSKLATKSDRQEDSYDLRNQLEYISSELASTKILCSKQQGEVLSYKKEIDKLTYDAAMQPIIKQEVTSLQRDLEASKNEVLNLHDQLKTAQADATGVVGNKNEETLHLRQELEGLHSQLESQSVLQDRLEVNVKEMSTLQCNLQAKSVELESYKKEMTRLRVSLETKTLELENSNKEVVSLHKRIQLEHEQVINWNSALESMKGGSNDENRITSSSFPESDYNNCRNCVTVREGLIRCRGIMIECFGPSTTTSRRSGRESLDAISSKSTLELLSSMEEVAANARGEHKRIKSAVRDAASSAKVQSEKCNSAIRSLENRVHHAELRVQEISTRRIPHRPTYPRRPPYWERAPSSGAALGHSLPGPLLLMGEKGSLLYELNCRLDQLRKILPACEGLVERSEALVHKCSSRCSLTDRRGNNIDIGGELLDLLDSNERVTKQLYSLGVDCQRVYGRFKAVMEWEGDRKCDDLYTVGRELEDLASSLKTLTGGNRT